MVLKNSHHLFEGFDVLKNFINIVFDERRSVLELEKRNIGSSGNEVPSIKPDRTLNSSSRNEVPSPETVRAVRVREEVVVLRRVGISFLVNSINVLRYVRVLHLHIVLRVLINVLHELIDVLVVLVRVHVLEVFAKRVHEVSAAVVQGHVAEVLNKEVRFLVDIVVLERGVVHNGVVRARGVEAEPRRR